MSELLTASEAGRLLDLAPSSVVRLERIGKLPALKTGRGLRLFQRSDVVKLAEQRAAKAAEEGEAMNVQA